MSKLGGLLGKQFNELIRVKRGPKDGSFKQWVEGLGGLAVCCERGTDVAVFRAAARTGKKSGRPW